MKDEAIAIPYEDAVELLDADHKAVKKLFLEYTVLCENNESHEARRLVVDRICAALSVHAQIEEEIFYPAVREASGEDALIDAALSEHGEAKDLIEQLRGMDAFSEDFDAAVQKLARLIDQHVLEEREQVFLDARYAPLDLRELAIPLFRRKKELIAKTPKLKSSKKENA